MGSDGRIVSAPCRSLHHDNTPSDTSVFMHQFLVNNQMAVIPHPTYSPDLAPCDFFLFAKMKLKLKGRRFDTIEEIQAESQRVLDTLIEKGFQEVFQKWKRQWDQCLHAGGNYFEGDGADRPYCEFYNFYSVSPESFGYHLVYYVSCMLKFTC